MEKLEEQIQQKEASFLAIVQGILDQSGSNRAKLALINKHYIRCLVQIDDLVAEANLATPAPSAAGTI